MGIVVSTGSKVPFVPPEVQREKRRQTRFLMGGGLVLVALGFVALLRLLAFEGVLITSGSMQPTLYKGDYTLVDHRAAIRGSWSRGDIVVFKPPAGWSGSDETLVKRVIGLPGETVTVAGPQVWIGNSLLRESYLDEGADPDPVKTFKLAPNQFFVMGDNRNNSDDSRNNGPISESDIKGRALYLLWPRSRMTRLETPDYGAAPTAVPTAVQTALR
ncbi:MAG TPA: signal peptidase I [Abditibacterium sp.]|jgi:signal peptidase I